MLFKKHNLTKYLKGKGIEIGALGNPLMVNPKKCRVTYVDWLDREGLIRHNPAVPAGCIRQPDVVGNAMDLNMFADESMDFVIASHLLEHLPNPIRAMKEFYRVLKTGGILYLTIPDKRWTFDKERPITSLSHLVDDYTKEAFLERDISHYKEWFSLVEQNRPPQTRASLEYLLANRCMIHFHVWQPESIIEMLNYMKNNLGVCYYLKDYYYRQKDIDFIFILKKASSSFCPDLPFQIKEKYSIIWLFLYRLKERVRKIKLVD